MLRVGIGVLVLLSLCCPVQAAQYWVVGSYGKKSNAFAEKERLEIFLGVEVLVVPNDERGTFRVIVATEDTNPSQLSEAGVEYWMTGIEVHTSQEEKSSGDGARGVAPALPPFKPNETLEAYCERVNTGAAFCAPEALAELAAKREKLSTYARRLDEKCAGAEDEREKQVCETWKEANVPVATADADQAR